jgi:predicted RNA binding protein YcfA (HicA-like mRNA interferase family)
VYYTHVKSAEILKLLKADGWYVFNIRGRHHQLKHLLKPEKVTVPHPKTDLPLGTVKSIFK